MSVNIDLAVSELAAYGLDKGLIQEEDKGFFINQVLSDLHLDDFHEQNVEEKRTLESILSSILEYAVENGIIEDSIVYKDLFDTKLMGYLTDRPSHVSEKFKQILTKDGAKAATDWFYQYCKDIDYIRDYRVKKDLVWKTSSPYGDIDITINLSKPEKDPKAIAALKNTVQSSYPKCMLCKENVGYHGRVNYPARENLRIIPLNLAGDSFFFQYSPYSYYNEHCIVFNSKHVPMVIDRNCFRHLAEFVSEFPHYMLGSNADLPIVGGSILTHDHYQGGSYIFPMFKAKDIMTFTFKGFEEVKASYIHWPLSVIRLRSKDKDSLVSLSEKILNTWRNYTDETCFIYSNTDGTPHNTITPICHFENGEFVFDLTLRNNIQTKEHPLGLYHPHEELWNIKKENIGLIEVMGRAVLPSRLKKELAAVKDHLLSGMDLKSDPLCEKHADWVNTFKDRYTFTEENTESILQDEVGKVFVKVLECAGVYKQDAKGLEGIRRFVEAVNR